MSRKHSSRDLSVGALLALLQLASPLAAQAQPGVHSRRALILKIESEVARIRPLHQADPSDGGVVQLLNATAYPSFERFASLLASGASMDRSDALILVRLTTDLMAIDNGPSSGEIAYRLHDHSALRALFQECPSGHATPGRALDGQGPILQLGLAPVTEPELCEIRSLFEDVARAEREGNG